MNSLDTAIYSKLSAGTGLTSLLAGTTSIYHIHAPEGASYPYIVFNIQGGGPENITPSDMRTYVEFVRGYGTTAAQVGSIDAQISSLLHQGSLTVSSYTNWWMIRETDLEDAYLQPNGKYVYMSGALYRIRLDN